MILLGEDMSDPPPLPSATTRDLLGWALRRTRRFRVTGPSMEPSLFDGDVVFVDADAYRSGAPEDLDIVVAYHPQKPSLEIIKRVEFTTEDGAYLVGDNSDAEGASDSRRFGIVAFDQVIGKVTAVAPSKKSTTLQR